MSRVRSDRELPVRPFILTLVVLGLILRFIDLSHHSFWGDEGWTLQTVSGSVFDLIHRCLSDVHPPLYFLLVKPFVGSNATEWSARLPSALASALALALLYRMGARRLSGRGLALFVAWVAVSSVCLQPAREARAYALLGLLGVAWLDLLDRWAVADPVDSPFPVAQRLRLALVLTLAIYTHHFGWLMLFTTVLVPFVLGRPSDRALPASSALALVAALPSLGWVLNLSRIAPVKTYSLVQMGKRVVGIVVHWTGGYLLSNMTLAEFQTKASAGQGPLFLTLVGVAIGLTLRGASKDRPWNEPTGRLLLTCVVAPMIMAACLDFSHLTSRYLVFCAPAFFLLVVRALIRLTPTSFGLGAVFILSANLFSTEALLTCPTDLMHKEDWRHLAAELSDRPSTVTAWVKAGAGTRYLFEFYRKPRHGPTLREYGDLGGSDRLVVVLGRSADLDLSALSMAGHIRDLEKLSGLEHQHTSSRFGEHLRLLEFGRMDHPAGARR